MKIMRLFFARIVVGLTFVALSKPASGIEITLENNAFALAEALFAPWSGQFTVLDAQLQGHVLTYSPEEPYESESLIEILGMSTGTFTNSSGTYGIGAGIVLSSGNVQDYADGFNFSGSQSTSYGQEATPEQQAILSTVTGSEYHYDVTQLTITFESFGEQAFGLFAVFGSEEYPNFVNTAYNDGLVVLLNDVNIAEANGYWTNIDHPDMSPIWGTELNGIIAPGFDPRLAFFGTATNGLNVLTILLGDATDSIYDSTAYFSAHIIEGPVPNVPLLPTTITEDGDFLFEDLWVEENTPVLLDPEVATGYDYTVLDGPNFATVRVAPAGFDTDFLISFGLFENLPLHAGILFNILDYVAEGVSFFKIRGIDPSVGLPLDDPLAFVTEVTFVSSGTVTVMMTPVPEIPSGIMATAALLVAALGRKRWRKNS